MPDVYTFEKYHFPSPTQPAALAAGEANSGAKILWSRKVASDLIGFCEALAIIAGGLLPTAIHSFTGALIPDWTLAMQSALIAALIYRMYLTSAGMYDTARTHDFAIRPKQMSAALAFAILAALSLGAPRSLDISNLLIWFALWFTASYAGAMLVRAIASDIMIAKTAQGYFDERIAVYGAGQIARRVHDHLSNPALGLRFMGVFDSRETPDRVNHEGLRVAGTLDELVEAAERGSIDRIIIALPQVAERRVNAIAKKFQDLPVHLHIVTHLSSDFIAPQRPHHVSRLGPVGLMDIQGKQNAGWIPFIKRLEDVCLGLLATVIAAPLLPLIALAIKLDSAGPVLVSRRHRGSQHQVIHVLKFRTHTQGRSDAVGETPAPARLTRTGAFLSRTGLEDLPQLWNVLRGEMSIVGPLPHPLFQTEKQGEILETFANRRQMKPGMVGLAKISGVHDLPPVPTGHSARFDKDLAYVREWSLWLDFVIIVRAFLNALPGRRR